MNSQGFKNLFVKIAQSVQGAAGKAGERIPPFSIFIPFFHFPFL